MYVCVSTAKCACSFLPMYSCSRWAPVLEFLRLFLLLAADVVTTSAATDLHLSDSKTWILRTILMVSITVWGYIVLFKVGGWKGKVKTK